MASFFFCVYIHTLKNAPTTKINPKGYLFRSIVIHETYITSRGIKHYQVTNIHSMTTSSQSQTIRDFSTLIRNHKRNDNQAPLTRIRVNEAWKPNVVQGKSRTVKRSYSLSDKDREDHLLSELDVIDERFRDVASLLTQESKQHDISVALVNTAYNKPCELKIAAPNVLNLLNLDQRLRLEDARIGKEASLPHIFHAVEFYPWETNIDWEGASRTNSSLNSINTHRIQLAQDILSEMYNPHLEAIDLDDHISWEGAAAPSSVNEKLAAKNGTLILEAGVVGSSILASSVSKSMYVKPFLESDVYKLRIDRKLQGTVKVHAAGVGALQRDKDLLEKEIQERQLKRAQIEKDKAQRIKGVLGKMDLAGTVSFICKMYCVRVKLDLIFLHPI